MDKINPEYAVLLVGKGNSYGHPHQETMNKLKKMGVKVHRSDECSDIIFESTVMAYLQVVKMEVIIKALEKMEILKNQTVIQVKIILLKINKIHPTQKK